MPEIQRSAAPNPVLFAGKNLYTLELSAPELLELAIWMERAGAEYYRYLADLTGDERVKKFFLRVMGMEIKHEKHLREIYRKVSEGHQEYLGLEDGITGGEYLKHLRQNAIKKIFPVGFEVPPEPGGRDKTRSGLEHALEAERKSSYLYNHLSKFKLYGDAREVVKRLYRDEKSHFDEIMAILKDLERYREGNA